MSPRLRRRINGLAKEDEGPLRVSSLSPAVIEDEYKEATETGMLPLIGLALLLIAGLLLLFMRTFSDVLLTLGGLILSLVWIVGAEGWLGPNALGAIGPPSSLTSMVPVIVISLTVDYAIQAVSHYREQRTAGTPVAEAVRQGLRNVTVPLTLAAVTTIVSLLATLFSPDWSDWRLRHSSRTWSWDEPHSDAHAHPGSGRMIIDRRRESRGRLSAPRQVSNALPGDPAGVGMVGKMGHALAGALPGSGGRSDHRYWGSPPRV